MPQFAIVYLGGNPPETPEAGKLQLAKYKKWLSSLGKRAKSPANPLKNTHTVKQDGSITPSSNTSMSGYTIIEAESMGIALDYARKCPFLETEGTLEVSELLQMPEQ